MQEFKLKEIQIALVYDCKPAALREILRKKLSLWLSKDKFTVTLDLQDIKALYSRWDRRKKETKFLHEILRLSSFVSPLINPDLFKVYVTINVKR